MKNTMLKTRPVDNPYEIWVCGRWEWRVLKKWQADDNKPNARWYCFVTSPLCTQGEYGDCYVKDIKKYAGKLNEVYMP